MSNSPQFQTQNTIQFEQPKPVVGHDVYGNPVYGEVNQQQPQMNQNQQMNYNPGQGNYYNHQPHGNWNYQQPSQNEIFSNYINNANNFAPHNMPDQQMQNVSSQQQQQQTQTNQESQTTQELGELPPDLSSLSAAQFQEQLDLDPIGVMKKISSHAQQKAFYDMQKEFTPKIQEINTLKTYIQDLESRQNYQRAEAVRSQVLHDLSQEGINMNTALHDAVFLSVKEKFEPAYTKYQAEYKTLVNTGRLDPRMIPLNENGTPLSEEQFAVNMSKTIARDLTKAFGDSSTNKNASNYGNKIYNQNPGLTQNTPYQSSQSISPDQLRSMSKTQLDQWAANHRIQR